MPLNLSSFILFSHLPPELRHVIWQQALPGNAPTLYSYTSGNRSNPESPNGSEGHNDLAEVHLELPLFFVNREANRIATAWLREQGMLMPFRENRQTHAFLRPYDVDRDALYVPASEIGQLSSSLPGMFGHVCCSEPNLARVAVPAEVLSQDSDTLAELVSMFSMETLYVIVGIQPGSGNGDSIQRLGERWELMNPQSNMALEWSRSRGCFRWRDGNSVGSEELHREMERAGKELARTLDWIRMDCFEMLPVSAVRIA
ncbi:unnamed protein product [Clonostachys rosea]|uniref:2EXR domain-containing protein n=1 Tax=Bionectria ochroleuca TaxID=29856 RepID=A0ABY6UZJ8_BIOOC|nr:unnamed protein product [Clonostachys rosea]